MMCGVGKAEMAFPDGLGLLGYGPLSGAGFNDATAGAPKLWARAMVLEDASKKRVYLGFVDLMGGSPVVTQRLIERLNGGVERAKEADASDDATTVSARNILILPSHTHSAPGHYTGNRIYDLQHLPAGFRKDVVEIIVAALASAMREATADMEEADVFVRPAAARGIGRNRSIDAFRANFDDPKFPGWPAVSSDREVKQLERAETDKDEADDDTPQRKADKADPPPGKDEERAVDPRFMVVFALTKVERTLIGTFAVIGVHNASLGRDYHYYHPDWAGLAVAKLGAPQPDSPDSHDEADEADKADEPKLPPLSWRDPERPWAAVAQGPAGDVTSIPVGHTMDDMGPELANTVADKVVAAWHRAIVALDRAASTLDIGFYRWRPRDDGLMSWDIGTPVINGCEESRTPYFFDPTRGEARRASTAMRFAQRFVAGAKGVLYPEAIASEREQMPKEPALGPLQLVLRKVLELTPGDEHPLHLLRIGDHVFFALPSEVTTVAAWKIERALLARLASTSKGKTVLTASPMAMVNDYMGYLTTAKEYATQNYEGALNLYGRRTLKVVITAVCDMVLEDGSFDLDRRKPLDLPRPLDAHEVEARVKRLAGYLSWPARQLMEKVLGGAKAAAPPASPPAPTATTPGQEA